MKKRLAAVLLCGCLVITGCGADKEKETDSTLNNNEKGQSGSLLSSGKTEATTVPTAGADDTQGGADGQEEGNVSDAVSTGAYWDPQGSVVLGTYTGIEVDKVNPQVSDEDVQYEIDSLLNQHSEPVEVTDRTQVQEEDYLCVDYTLYVDGEAVDVVEEEYLTLGQNYYDFESGLAGALVGESKTIECEIEDYVYSDYQGQTGNYVVTVKSINKQVVPELNDAFIAENTEFDTVEAYREDIYNTLLADAQKAAKDDEVVAAFEKIIEGSEFSGLSDADVQSYVDEVVSYYEQYASSWGMELEGLISLFLGTTYDDFLAMAKEDGEYVVKQNLILDAVVSDASLSLDDVQYKAALEQYAADNGFESADEVEDTYNKADLVKHFLRDKAYDVIVDSIVAQ